MPQSEAFNYSGFFTMAAKEGDIMLLDNNHHIPRGVISNEVRKKQAVIIYITFMSFVIFNLVVFARKITPYASTFIFIAYLLIWIVSYIIAFMKDKINDDKETEFAFRYSNSEWHPITDDEMNLLKPYLTTHKNTLTKFLLHSVAIFALIFFASMFICPAFYMSSSALDNVIWFDIIITLLITLYRFLTSYIWSNHLDCAETYVFPVYMTYPYTFYQKGHAPYTKYQAIAYYKNQKYVYEIASNEQVATDMIAVNVGRFTRVFPVVIKDNMNR